jgi:uncharacterized protein
MISQSELRAGLSDDELDELDAFLTSRCVPHDGMNLSMLDGYLTAIVSGPEFPAPSAWLSQVWGQEESGDDGFAFTSIEETKHVHSLVLRRMNEISHDFERGEINPIFLTSENAEIANMWCVGYTRGIRLRSQSWAPLLQGEDENAMLLFPISAIAAGWLQLASEEQEKMLHAYLNDEKRAELTKRVPRAAYDVYRYWRKRRTSPATPIRSAPRPGRNELCPCGSTKKYKKCCG